MSARTVSLTLIVTAITVVFVSLLAAGPASAQFNNRNILKNGSFEHADGPFTDWMIDYAWTENDYYVDNKEHVSLIEQDGSRINVVKMEANMHEGTKLESLPIKFEQGFRYNCSVDIKGGPYKIWIVGHKWKPGIRPHDSPHHGELREIYRCKRAEGKSRGWKTEKISLPGIKLSAMAKQNLRYVRWITVYVFAMDDIYVDNIILEKVPDNSTNF